MDNKLIKVEGEQGIARDLLSGAILSVDQNAFDIWKIVKFVIEKNIYLI